MPVLFQICVEGNTGSTGRMAEEIGVMAIQKGWKSYIAHGRFSRPSKSETIKIGSDLDIILHGLQTRLFDRHCLGSRLATRRLIQRIETIKPDIIHLHHLHGYYINIEILFDFLSRASIPVVWTFHDCWSITGHCAYFDFVGCTKWKTACNSCPQKNEYPTSWFLDRSRKNFHFKKALFTSVQNMTVVSVSNWLNNIVRESFMCNVAKRVIYNGVDVDLFKPDADRQGVRDKYNIGKRFIILGVASPWGKRKGLMDFINLSKRIDRNSVILLVGLSRSQIDQLPGNIIGITRTENQHNLKDLYVTSGVFLNLSAEETFGLTTAEALACGTPAIVYNTTACPEIVDVDTGLVVEKNDMNGLLDAIETIKKNRKEHYSNICRERAVNFFDKNVRFAEYIDLYQSLCSINLSN